MTIANETNKRNWPDNIDKTKAAIQSIVFIFPKGFKLFPANILPFCLSCNYFPKLSIIPTNWSPTNRA